MENKKAAKAAKDLVKQAFNFVYTDFEQYVRAIAKEHTIANMGQDIEELAYRCSYLGPPRVEMLIDSCYNSLYSDCETDEMANGLDKEYRTWLKYAKRDATKVKKAGLPWTVQNARDFFDGKRKLHSPALTVPGVQRDRRAPVYFQPDLRYDLIMIKIDRNVRRVLESAAYDCTIGCGETEPDVLGHLVELDMVVYTKFGRALTDEEGDFFREEVKRCVQMMHQP